MRAILLITFSTLCTLVSAQVDDRITTLDFVQILNGNDDEARYYYQNNWWALREIAIEKGYIHSFEILESPRSDDTPFDLILVTTYPNEQEYDLREDHFNELIEARGELKLLNEKEPGEFRKFVFSRENVRHWR